MFRGPVEQGPIFRKWPVKFNSELGETLNYDFFIEKHVQSFLSITEVFFKPGKPDCVMAEITAKISF